MAREIHPRDYSLAGPLNKRAQEAGLANAEWYKSIIPRARLKELMQRCDVQRDNQDENCTTMRLRSLWRRRVTTYAEGTSCAPS